MGEQIEHGAISYCGNDTECALLLLADELGDGGYTAIRKRHRDDEVRGSETELSVCVCVCVCVCVYVCVFACVCACVCV